MRGRRSQTRQREIVRFPELRRYQGNSHWREGGREEEREGEREGGREGERERERETVVGVMTEWE